MPPPRAGRGRPAGIAAPATRPARVLGGGGGSVGRVPHPRPCRAAPPAPG